MKAALAVAPVLAFPDFSKPSVLLTDCSDAAKGAALTQTVEGKEMVICYLSQALNEHEKGYGITDKEGLAATWAVRKLRRYLHANHTILITDHSSLLSLVKGKELESMRQQRYAMDLSEYSIEIVHRAGALLHLPDTLNRLGYTKEAAWPMVSHIKDRHIEECTVQGLKRLFCQEQMQGNLSKRIEAAGYGGDSIEKRSRRLENTEKITKLVQESEEEESRTVEMYDMVSALTREKRKATRKEDTDVAVTDSTDAEHSGTVGQPDMTTVKGEEIVDGEIEETAGEAGQVAIPEQTVQMNAKAIQESQQHQPFMKAMTTYITDQTLPTDRLEKIKILESAPLYEVNSKGLLCRIRERGKQGSLGLSMQVMVPAEMREEVIAGCHEGKEGHASVLKTFQKLRERFYWPGMFTDVQLYLKYCAQCQLTQRAITTAPIKRHTESSAPGEAWVMDLLHYPSAKEYKYVLVVVDAYSRWAEAVAIKDKRAETVAEALITAVITNTTGQPKLIVSDQGSEFKGDLKAAMELLKVEQRYTAAYRSEGHGLAERYNRSLGDRLKSMVSQTDPQWYRALPWAKLAYNNTPHRALSMNGEGITPAEVHLGRKLNLNLEAAMDSVESEQGERHPSELAQT